MFSIYGSYTPKVDINQFVFDKIYENVESMKKAAASDGVLPGRYVLVRYPDDVVDSIIENDIKNNLPMPEIIITEEIDGKIVILNQDEAVTHLTNYQSTVWRKERVVRTGEIVEEYRIICQLEPGTTVRRWMNSKEGQEMLIHLLPEALEDLLSRAYGTGDSTNEDGVEGVRVGSAIQIPSVWTIVTTEATGNAPWYEEELDAEGNKVQKTNDQGELLYLSLVGATPVPVFHNTIVTMQGTLT